ncbi:hypothetical protein ABD91_25970 [Lysinibacillus sphaericus]|uniref:hypothetical protein n=1 Tax=Lysinibacillus sphaericus TaxID=1421 RepID=UPI0018CF81BE|nr:hypothetical protein [Lysinibacillus sphaericus]MBG9694181.1 hypothetical protein [Lysinibacillus sphaericus]
MVNVLIGFGSILLLVNVSFLLWIMVDTSDQPVDNQNEKGGIGGGNSNYSSYDGKVNGGDSFSGGDCGGF